MNTREMIREIKRVKGIRDECEASIIDLTEKLREKCKHSKVTETSTSHSDDWDRTTTTWYTRKCLRCALTEATATYSYNYSCEKEEKKFLKLLSYTHTGEMKAEIE